MLSNPKFGIACALEAPKTYPTPIVDKDIYASAKFLADNGFECIELHLRDASEIEGARFYDYCCSIGISVAAIGTGMAFTVDGLSLTSSDASVRKEAMRRMKAHHDLAEELGGAKVFIGTIHGRVPDGGSLSQIDAMMLDACKELADHAAGKRSLFAVEPINPYRTNYLVKTEDVLDLLDRIGSDRFCVLIDTYHLVLTENSWKQPLLACGSRLGHIHAVENNRGYPGEGLVDFRSIFEALDELSYSGAIVMECSQAGDARERAILGSKYMRSLLRA